MGESENMSSKQSSEISSHNSNQSIDNDCTQNVTFHHSTYDSGMLLDSNFIFFVINLYVSYIFYCAS